MKASEVISYVDSIEPNAYSNEQKTGWINTCEGKVYTDLFLVQPYEFTPVVYDEDNDRTLAIPAPYDRLYPEYLQAMIHYANGEYNRYANSMAVFNDTWAQLNCWFGGDYDVTDRLRNTRFSADVNPEPGQQILMEIPEGCALAAGRIIIKQPYKVDIPRYYAMSTITAGDYCKKNADDTYGCWTLDEDIPEGGWMRYDLTWDTPTLFWRQSLESELHSVPITISAEKTGTELDFICFSQLWMDDPAFPIGERFSMEERGTIPIPMEIAERGGSKLGISVGPGYWNPQVETGHMAFTGHLFIPDEEWSYEDRYELRRSREWRR